MKGLLFHATMVLCLTSYGQNNLEEGMEFTTVGEIRVSEDLYVSCKKTNETYYFEYSDSSVKEKPPMSFQVNYEKGEFEKLFTAIMYGSPEVPCRGLKVELDSDDIWLEFTKSQGVEHVRFLQNTGSQNVSYSPWLTKVDMTILFGRNNRY
ncbi:MAG: hypothetical protein AAGA43_00225 [Bacteroidota bacterium]